MKKFITLLLAFAMMISMSACSSTSNAPVSESTTPESTGIFKNPGTYTASQKGVNDDVTLTVEFSENEIVSIQVDQKETPTIGGAALETLVNVVLENQSLAVDSISGATISSEAFINALNDCVEQAGGDKEALNKEIIKNEVNYQTEADVIVVGAGAAGLTAAVSLSNQGKKVILIEKSSSVGGNTLCAANGINALDADVQLNDENYQSKDTSKDDFVKLHTNELNKDNLSLVETFADASKEMINYYANDLGVEFTVDIQEDQRNNSSNYYMLKALADGSTAITMINAISSALDKTDVIVYKNMDATELVVDKDVVTGVVATDAEGNAITFNGSAVLLCTGGFGQNQQLVGEVNPDLAGAVTDEQAPTTGEGLMMATAIGAGTVDLGEIQTFPSVIPGSGMFMSFGLWRSGDAIVVNKNGERFTQETFEMPKEILAQPTGLVAGIFDADNYSDRYDTLIANGFMYKADTLDELADLLNVDAEALNATVAKWNEDAQNGTDTVFGRENLTTIDAPYYGYVFGVGAHFFMGGITINSDMQVLDTEGNVIEGLYAAGEVTGGLHGAQRVDGTGLGESFTEGLVAANVLASK